jgi:hypothetical protein
MNLKVAREDQADFSLEPSPLNPRGAEVPLASNELLAFPAIRGLVEVAKVMAKVRAARRLLAERRRASRSH